MLRSADSCRRILTLGALLFFITLSFAGCAGVNVSTYFEHGALATASPIATEIGIKVFRVFDPNPPR